MTVKALELSSAKDQEQALGSLLCFFSQVPFVPLIEQAGPKQPGCGFLSTQAVNNGPALRGQGVLLKQPSLQAPAISDCTCTALGITQPQFPLLSKEKLPADPCQRANEM